jgi:hypothetical protein
LLISAGADGKWDKPYAQILAELTWPCIFSPEE